MDVATKIETLLSDNWTDSNTDSFTPAILQITNVDSKRYDFNTNKFMILIHRPVLRFEKNGVGADSKRARHTVRIDLRVLGKELEETYSKMYNEIIRILDANINNPFTGYNEIDYEDKDQQDLSDKNKGLFRVIIPVNVINYCIMRGN